MVPWHIDGEERKFGQMKGWMAGGLNIKIRPENTNDEFVYFDGSPNTVNSVTTYTTSTSFTVGLSANGSSITASGSYTEQESTSKGITDWAITQITDGHWQFNQAVPFNGLNFHDATHGNIYSIPAISTTSLDYDTQTVWQTHSPKSGNQNFQLELVVWPYCRFRGGIGAPFNLMNTGWATANGVTALKQTITVNFDKANPD